MYYPVSVEERVQHADKIVIARLSAQYSYWDRAHQIINTLNIMEVTAYLKGHSQARQIGVITLGGIVDDRAMFSHPSLEIMPFNEYILFLQGDNFVLDHPGFRQSNPDLIQCETYADAQGALTKQQGFYHDLLVLPKMTEAEIMYLLQTMTHEPALTPQGNPFQARPGDTFPLGNAGTNERHLPITNFTPNPTNAGTIVPADFITITGSGFGAAAGTVFYTNADDGGATFTSSGVASDNTAWADGSITNKVARRAGTGPINVNGAMTSGSNLNIIYSHIEVNSNFSGFGSSTRQRYYLRNISGSGGYSFQYNTTFNANTAAANAFRRAVATWRCATFVNFSVSSTTTGTAAVSTDGVNCVFFNAGLAAGVLGRATSHFSGSGGGGCTLANTVWYTAEIDVDFKPDPPSAGFPWEFGPAAPAFSEFDFESVAVHELGHAHGLGHVISPGAVMHFAISNGASARNPNANEIAGGNAKMGYSTSATCLNPAGSGTPMVALTPANCALAVNNALLISGEHQDRIGNTIFWDHSDELSVASYTIQRKDGGDFLDIGTVAMDENAMGSYQFLDAAAPLARSWQYRVRVNHSLGASSLSEIVEIQDQIPGSVTVYPSLASDWVAVKGMNPDGAPVRLQLTDMSGRVVFDREVYQADGIVAQHFSVADMAAGIYGYHVLGARNPVSGKLVISR